MIASGVGPLLERRPRSMPVWPFCTGTRVVVALIVTGWLSTAPFVSAPRIFFVSVSIFSSSPPPMYGMTLPRMSHDGTPG